MRKSAIAIVLLLSAIGMNLSVHGAVVKCNSRRYDIGTRFSLNVDSCLLHLQKEVPRSELRDTTFHSSNPDIYAHANCSTSITTAECASCLESVPSFLTSNCSTAVGASVVLDDCTMRYETYRF